VIGRLNHAAARLWLRGHGVYFPPVFFVQRQSVSGAYSFSPKTDRELL
jgi:hypothetical protein